MKARRTSNARIRRRERPRSGAATGEVTLSRLDDFCSREVMHNGPEACNQAREGAW